MAVEINNTRVRTLSEETLQEIVRRIVEAAASEKIILFGSAARGEMGPDSDLDLLVVKACENRREAAQAPAAMKPSRHSGKGRALKALVERWASRIGVRPTRVQIQRMNAFLPAWEAAVNGRIGRMCGYQYPLRRVR